MGLFKLHAGVFLRLDFQTAELLRIAEAYVVFGSPNFKSISDLLYKRGFGRVNKKRVPLTDNLIIEKELGKYGIICLEDIVHEIHNMGPNFDVVRKFLWSFFLSSPLGGYNKRTLIHSEGFGELNIDGMLKTMI